MTQRNFQELEHKTGLILTPPIQNRTNQDDDQSNNNTIEATPIKCTATIEALRALRDSNPSLLNKLEIKASEFQIVDSDNDTYLEYWNSIQDVITLHDGDASLKCLNLGGLMVRIKTMTPFMDTLKKSNMNKLEVLNLGGTDIFLSNLLESIEGKRKRPETNENEQSSSMNLFNSLQRLYLSGCGISCQRDGIETLCSILKHMPNLRILDLRYNDLQKTQPQHSVVKQGGGGGGGGEEKEELDINQPLKRFFENFLSQSNIEVLHLEGNNLGNDVMEALGKALANPNIKMRELYMGSNKIGAKGAELVVNGLKTNQTVEKIYLEGNYIGDEGAGHFCTLLEGKQQKDDDDGACATTVLEKLWVENNGVGKDMMKRLGIALQSSNVVVDL